MDIENVFKEFPSMETHRISLKELKEDYDKDLFGFFSDRKVMEYYDIKPLETIDDARRLIGRFIDKYSLLREYAFFKGEFRDLIMLSLLKKDYIKNI
ncbi:hypothetical protein [Clostridium pasteurianum]|uniref:Uncharacterized protein n=1 Tax=Clostridium pasteurianum BC1 TaxID=86416 RepID=R4K9M6_CLOPA|nr:hypothetical protein [Clostridium pasteurianum]AGK99268.1 hypothetical protein Clopa_4572 [Clostridium pasteurianum BC1]